jgi:hypothetical protein
MSNKPWLVNLRREDKLLREKTIRKNATQKWMEAGCPPGRYADFGLQAEKDYDWLLFQQWQDRPLAYLIAPPVEVSPLAPPVEVQQAREGWDYNVHGVPNPKVP